MHEYGRHPKHAIVPEDMEPPAANWRFSEGSGLTSKDEEGEHNVTLSDAAMWQRSRLSTNFTLYLNGYSIPNLESCTADSLGGYGELKQMTIIGGLQYSNTKPDDKTPSPDYPFQGALDELRLWNVARTRQQIQENMHIEIEADEAGLIGYWPLTAGEGNSVKDWVNGSQATVSDPSKFWIKENAAPVGDEAPPLLADTFPVQSSWSVSAIEYGDLVTNDKGALHGVMKRCYALAKMDGSCELLSDFKVGNLEMEYLGQAETDPTLIGYIEGAPPLPQENLTVPYYGNPRGYNSYAGAASVQFIEADNTLRTYSAHRDKGIDYSVAAKFGFKGGADFYAGLGLEAEFLGTDNKIGMATSLDTSLGFLSGAEVTVGSTKTVTNEFQSGGGWTDGNKDNTPERCYVPDNIGYALIKSHVANVYALYAKKTRSLVAIHLSPDPDIPEDFSIIAFKINPNYTKQGNLETYYRPKEAYDLIARIEAYEAQLEADYQNYDTRKKAPQRETANDPLESITSDIEVPYDWEKMRSRRNMVNSYVWTADGGFYAEEEKSVVTRQESMGNSYNFSGAAGMMGDFSLEPGFFLDASALMGTYLHTTVTKNKSEGRDFEIKVNVSGEAFLLKYKPGPNDTFTYSKEPTPGKVLAYRFKTFYLVPEKEHFDAFFKEIIDPEWLNSNHQDAKLMREAKGRANLVWCVMHRVTLIKRVPSKPDDAPQIETEEETRPIINVIGNQELIAQVKASNKKDTVAAVQATLEALKQDASSILAQADVATYKQVQNAVLSYMEVYLSERHD